MSDSGTVDVAANPYPEIAEAEQVQALSGTTEAETRAWYKVVDKVEAELAEAEAYANTVPEDGRWRPEQVHPRGRWRTKKRAIRALAEDLGYPECLEVAHPEQVDGGVGQAGVRLRDFYKLHRGRTTPAQAKAERAQRRADRRAMAALLARGEPPF